jgi:hypothetical protein
MPSLQAAIAAALAGGQDNEIRHRLTLIYDTLTKKLLQ